MLDRTLLLQQRIDSISLPPTVPTELVEKIIDQLRFNRGALCSCSLVCRRWIPRARFLLFSNVTIDVSSRNGEALDHFLAFIRSSAEAAKAHSFQFSCVHQVIQAMHIYEPLPAFRTIGRAPRVAVRTMRDLLSALPDIRRLELVDVCIDDNEAPKSSHAEASKLESRSIESLRLELDTLEVSYSLLSLLHIFSHVENLHIRFRLGRRIPDFPYTYRHHIPLSGRDLASPAHLTVVKLCLDLDQYLPRLIEYLVQVRGVSQVRELSVRCYSGQDVACLEGFLQNAAVSNSVANLRIDISESYIFDRWLTLSDDHTTQPILGRRYILASSNDCRVWHRSHSLDVSSHCVIHQVQAAASPLGSHFGLSYPIRYSQCPVST